MAQIIDDIRRVFYPITKFEKTPDGLLHVWGKVTSDEIDLDDQYVDKSFARSGLQEWFDVAANVREMHQPSAVGKGIDLEERDDGFYLHSKIVDPVAIRKIEEGVYTGYSVGISRPSIEVDREKSAQVGRRIEAIKGGRFVEVSTVDRPALPSALFMIGKRAADDSFEYVGAEVEIDKAAYEPTPYHADPDETVVCPHCDKHNDTDARYCDQCGYKLIGAEDVEIGKAVHDHEHTHVMPDGSVLTHSHPHRHAANSAPHGQNHMHSHPDGEPEEVTKAEDAKCPTCKGSGKILEGHRKCPDCGGSGDKADYDARADKYALVKRDMDPNVGGGVDRDKIPAEDFAGPHRSYPIVKPGDVSDAASSLGRADQADRAQIKRRIIAIARRKGKEFVAELPDSWQDGTKAIRAVHDALCAVYSTDALKAVYPEIEAEGLASFTGIDWPEDVLLAAREELHKSFSTAYAAKGDIPKPGDPPNPASFRRPYIAAGTQREDGEGAPAPRMPKGTHTPDAADFDRGPLGGDEERQSPGDKMLARVGPGHSAAEYLKSFNDNREAAALAWLHDSIAHAFPDMCFMDTSDTNVHDNGAGNVPEPVTLAAESDTTVPSADVEKLISEAIERQNKAHQDAIAELERRIHELEAAPDPARAPVRGASVEKRARAEEDTVVSEAEARADRWRKLAETTGDPKLRDELRGVLKEWDATITK